MERKKSNLAGVLMLMLALTGSATETNQPDQVHSGESAAEITSHPYIPPVPAEPTPLTRVATGGTRGPDIVFPTVTLLVPEHVARTVLDQPVIFWHLSRSTQQPTIITLSINDQINPLLELEIASPVQAGIHRLDFGEYDIQLEPGKIYEWSVSINANADNASSADLVARGFIQRIEETQRLLTIAQEKDPIKKALAYARHGIWYDALAILSQETSDKKQEEQLHQQKTGLLNQVGIDLPLH